MTCRVCNQPLSHLLTYENMPAMAQHLSDTPEEHTVTLDLCQCRGCGLVQLANEPVDYWQTPIRTNNAKMNQRIEALKEGMDFISCNHLEHVPNPNQYLQSFAGMGIIEVPNFDMILEKRMFAEIMLDHLMYFTEDTLRFTLQYNGFTVCSIKPVWDEYILSAMVVKRNDLQLSPFIEQQAILKRALDEYISKHGRVAIYGASHQAFAYIAMLQPEVVFVVDDAPFKQNRYTPTGNLPIYNNLALLEGVDAVIIMGAGYSDEIAKTLEFDGSVAIMRDWGVEVIK
jgi:hypothetical protein